MHNESLLLFHIYKPLLLCKLENAYVGRADRFYHSTVTALLSSIMDMTSVLAGDEKKQQAVTILVAFTSGIIFLGLVLYLADREPSDTPGVIHLRQL